MATAPNPLTHLLHKICPECSGPLTRASGCVTCLQCGWSRCQ